MAYQSESIRGIKIRVFNWIQHMIKNRVTIHHDQLGSSSRFGFLVLRVKNQTRVIKPRNRDSKNVGGQTRKTTFKKSVQPFKICETSQEFVESIDFALGLSNLFFKDTIPHLANTIYDYLSSSFGKSWSNMDGEFSKIVVAIDVDMKSGRFEIGSQGFNDICNFQVTDFYETLMNDDDDDNNKEKEGEFCLQVDGVRESCVRVCKRRRILDVNMDNKFANDGVSKDEEGAILALEVKYAFDDHDIQDILDSLLDFLTKRKGFNNKVEAFDGEQQEFWEVKSELKIIKFEKKNVMSFELGDTCPICLEIFEEKSFVVITPCSHIFHRSCIFTWLLNNNTCPICRESCDG